jgi:hypothetical protein
MRRYARFQGYAWLGAVAVAGLAYGGSELLSPRRDAAKEEEPHQQSGKQRDSR